MTETIFFQLLDTENKSTKLRKSVEDLSQALLPNAFLVKPCNFTKVSGSPFAYWVNDSVLSLFDQLQPFGKSPRTATLGLTSNDDFRFIRLSTEISVLEKNNGFSGFAKGGDFSRYYSDIYLLVNWGTSGDELKAFSLTTPGTTHWSRNIRSPDKYFRPGLTWPLRTTSGLGVRIMPRNCVFGHKGPCIFFDLDDEEELLNLLSVTNSSAFQGFVSIQIAAADSAARSYEVGLIQRTPIPVIPVAKKKALSALSREAWGLKRSLDTITQTSHAFSLPAHLQASDITLIDRAQSWITKVTTTEQQLSNIQAEIDEIAFNLYNIRPEDINSNQSSTTSETETDDDEDHSEPVDLLALTHSLIEYTLGIALGRFDLRLATGERPLPPEPEPFDPLPVCSPGMLVTSKKLPPISVEELPLNYPIDIPFDGILADDQSHPNDLIRHLRPVLDIFFAAQAGDIEQEACQHLKTPSLRDYFAKPNAFFTHHLSRYSKSRRYAPIYWPLSTASGSYTLWIYYHRLTDQTLYTCINNYLEPKLTQTTRTITAILTQPTRTPDDETQLETLQTLEQELTALRDDLLRIAQLPYKPNLNDGVQITAAPLWKCFRLKKWQTKLKDTWEKLEQGEYDWAHLAYSIWPDRVTEKCKHDKSLAIAHDLENLYEPPPEKAKKKRKKKT